MYRLHERLVNLRSEYSLRLRSGISSSQVPLSPTQSSHTLQQAPVRVRPELDEVTLRYIQDLLVWVEDNQRRVAQGEWGLDLPTVESHLGSHRGLHHSVEEFRSKIDRAKADEVWRGFFSYGIPGAVSVLYLVSTSVVLFLVLLQTQISPVSRGAYRDYLSKLEMQYGKLLVSVTALNRLNSSVQILPLKR